MNNDQKDILLQALANTRDSIAELNAKIDFVEKLVHSIQPIAAFAPVDYIPAGKPKAPPALGCSSIALLASGVCQVPVDQLYVPSRKPYYAFPRMVAMFLMVHAGHSLTAIGRHFAKDHSTVIYAVRVVNDQRDVNLTFRQALDTALAKLNPPNASAKAVAA